MSVTVVTVGLAVLDLVLGVDRFPSAPGKQFARSSALVGGGPAATAAVAVARLGGRAMFVGRIGDDPVGGLILHDLATEGVRTDAVGVVSGATSPMSSVLVDATGERSIVNHLDPGLHLDPPGPLPAGDAYVADVRWPAGAEAAMVEAAERGVPGVLDLDRTDRGVPEAAVSAASHVVAAADAFDADPEDTLEALAQRTAAAVAVTAGARGVARLVDGRVRWLAPPAVEVVDTLGAGDVFHGAFALALAEGRDDLRALRFASAAAAVKCTRPGGRAGIPNRAEVDEVEGATWS